MGTGNDQPLAAVPATDAPVPAPPAGLLEKLMAAVRPEFRSDVLVFDPQDPVFGGPPCRVDGCGRTGRIHGLCSSHAQRWKRHGRPDLEEFIATTDPELGGLRTTGERFDLRPLRPQLRLEIQYALQCRHEEGRGKTAAGCAPPVNVSTCGRCGPSWVWRSSTPCSAGTRRAGSRPRLAGSSRPPGSWPPST